MMKNIAFTRDISTRKIKYLSMPCCLMKANFYRGNVIVR